MGKRLTPEEKRARAAAMELEALRDEKSRDARVLWAQAGQHAKAGDYLAAIARGEEAVQHWRKLAQAEAMEDGDGEGR